MSYNSSPESTINTPDISTGFIEFLANGELDEMLSNTPRRVYYSNLLSPETISVDETRNDVKHISEDCFNQQQTNDKPNNVDLWVGEDSDAYDNVCLEALERYIWGEDFANDEKMLLEACIESST